MCCQVFRLIATVIIEILDTMAIAGLFGYKSLCIMPDYPSTHPGQTCGNPQVSTRCDLFWQRSEYREGLIGVGIESIRLRRTSTPMRSPIFRNVGCSCGRNFLICCALKVCLSQHFAPVSYRYNKRGTTLYYPLPLQEKFSRLLSGYVTVLIALVNLFSTLVGSFNSVLTAFIMALSVASSSSPRISIRRTRSVCPVVFLSFLSLSDCNSDVIGCFLSHRVLRRFSFAGISTIDISNGSHWVTVLTPSAPRRSCFRYLLRALRKSRFLPDI